MTFANDTFTDTDGTLLQSHTADDGGSWTKGATWTENSEVQSNGLQISSGVSGSSSSYRHSGTPGSNEYDVQALLRFANSTSTDIQSGVFGRYDGNATGYHARYNAVAEVWQLYKVSSGSFSLIGSYAEALPVNTTRTLKLEIRTAAKKLYVDGIERVSSANDDITSTGGAGLRVRISSGTANLLKLDDFTATDAGGSATYTGSASVTLGGVTVSASATHTEPTYEGNADMTLGGVEVSASGTTTEPTYTAAADITLGGVTVDGSAAFTAPVYEATASITLGGVTVDGTATFATETFTASGDVTLGGVTVAGTATHTEPVYTATADVTLGAVAVTGVATHTEPVFTADGSVTLGGVTVAGTATFADDTFTGSASVTLGGVSVSADATFTVPTYTASASITLAGVTISATDVEPATGNIFIGNTSDGGLVFLQLST